MMFFSSSYSTNIHNKASMGFGLNGLWLLLRRASPIVPCLQIRVVKYHRLFCVKGNVSRDFRPLVFFSKTTPSVTLIPGLKPF
jgi:hypothetical protein